jgi:hypothetical protein
MKKAYARTLLTALLLATSYLSIKVVIKMQANETEKHRLQNLPRFTFINASDNKKFTEENINEEHLIINYFHPECDHCKHFVNDLHKYKNKLTHTQILMITIAGNGSINSYKKELKLDSLNHLIILRDPYGNFPRIFGTSVVPSFFIYGKHRLIKKIIGETKFENLISK